MVPDFTVPSLNDFLGRHWSRINRAKKALADLLGVYACKAGVPRVTPAYRPVRRFLVTVVGWPSGETMPDPDNLNKVLRDAAVSCGLLVDDSLEWCETRDPLLQRGAPPAGVFSLADLSVRPAVNPADDPHTRRLLAAKLRSARRGKKA